MVTPNLPDATCFTALDLESPFGSGVNRMGSSPPSPVFERALIRFVATANVSCASRLMEPREIAPVANRSAITDAGSTSSSGMLSLYIGSSIFRIVMCSSPSSFDAASNCRNTLSSLRVTASCNSAIVSGFHMWRSPVDRHR